MGYDNFLDAFIDFRAQYSSWRTTLTLMDTQRSQMIVDAGNGSWNNAFMDAAVWMGCVTTINKTYLDLIQSSYWNNHFIMSIYQAWKDISNIPESEVTMDSILSVMVTAEQSQLRNFIGLVDAYRQSLWNKEFNAEYFAAIARGFE